jgi:hypothetical protein
MSRAGNVAEAQPKNTLKKLNRDSRHHQRIFELKGVNIAMDTMPLTPKQALLAVHSIKLFPRIKRRLRASIVIHFSLFYDTDKIFYCGLFPPGDLNRFYNFASI